MGHASALKVLVITMLLSLGSSRPGARRRRNNEICPVKCFVDQKNQLGLMREVAGSTIVETRPVKHCDEECSPSQSCFMSQDPADTQTINYICAHRSALCDYNEDRDCEFHVVESGSIVKPLPWPFDKDSNESEPEREPSISEYNSDNCPVCMRPDLSRLDCLESQFKTEKCLQDESCWLYELSGHITVHITGERHITFTNIIKCQKDELAQSGCGHKKCTGKVSRLDQTSVTDATSEVSLMPIEDITSESTGVVTVKPEITTESAEVVTEKPESTTESAGVVTEKPEITTESAGVVTEKPESTTESAGVVTEKPEITTESVEAVTEKPEGTTDSRVTTENKKAPTDAVKQTTNPVTESPTQQLDNLEVEERNEVCSADVQECDEGRKCYGLVMEDGSVDYLCAASVPDCTQDSGCSSQCQPAMESCGQPEFTGDPTGPTEQKDSAVEKPTEQKDNTLVKSTKPDDNTVEEPTKPDDIDNNGKIEAVEPTEPTKTEVCSADVQECDEGRKCYGLVMEDGSVDYLCAASVPDCTQDSGCSSQCQPAMESCGQPEFTGDPTGPTEQKDNTDEKPTEQRDNTVEKSTEQKDNNGKIEAVASSEAERMALKLFLLSACFILLLH